LERNVLFHIESSAEELLATSPAQRVAVVDPFSTGAMVAHLLSARGIHVVAVYSASMEQLGNLQNLVPKGITLNFVDVVAFEDIEVMAAKLKGVTAILPGTETGVELADKLSEVLNLRNNGTDLSEARRNKYVMGETVRAAGVRAVRQLKASVWGEIEAWLTAWNPNPYKVIVKPLDSAGSDDVTLCLNQDEVKQAFGNIVGKVNGLGLVNRAVLVQEYLEGQEYVIDTVSRDGVHKVVAIWAYDRRAVNGAQFVCFGQRLLTMSDEHCEEIVAYQLKVLDALGIKHGPTHGEVKWHHGEPVLIEVGARCHGKCYAFSFVL
jgi:biotin carboxylase